MKENSHQEKESKSLTKNIPRTLEYEADKIVENNIAYFENEFEDWKLGKRISQGKVWESFNIKTGEIAAIKEIDLSKDNEKERKLT